MKFQKHGQFEVKSLTIYYFTSFQMKIVVVPRKETIPLNVTNVTSISMTTTH